MFDEWNWWKLFAIESAKIYAGIALGQTDEGGANDRHGEREPHPDF